MNDLAKNILLWVVVAVVLMVVFQSFSPKLAASQDVIYSQFVQDVENDRIKTVDISSNERSIAFERADGTVSSIPPPSSILYHGDAVLAVVSHAMLPAIAKYAQD